MTELSRGKLMGMVLVRFVGGFGVLLAFLLIPAGTFAFWEVWAYTLTLIVPMTLAMVYLFRKDRALLERRMRAREKERAQKWIMAFGTLSYVTVFLLCGFDRRWDWSSVPVGAVVAADIVVLISYLAILRTLQANTYASRTVEVVAGQQVITTGPYAIVRHPMYTAAIAFYLATPVGLGSWWGALMALPMIAVFVARIYNEEKLLLTELPGYREYMQVTRYRLIPHIW